MKILGGGHVGNMGAWWNGKIYSRGIFTSVVATWMKVDKVGVYMSGWNGGRLMELHLLCCYMRGAGVVPETCLASRTWINVVSWRYWWSWENFSSAGKPSFQLIQSPSLMKIPLNSYKGQISTRANTAQIRKNSERLLCSGKHTFRSKLTITVCQYEVFF